jgi:hypothetical protein
MLSHGPRTNEGKAKSSQNALKHGLSARHALLAGEDPNEYRRLRQGLIAEFSPQSALESELVERVASMCGGCGASRALRWRLWLPSRMIPCQTIFLQVVEARQKRGLVVMSNFGNGFQRQTHEI